MKLTALISVVAAIVFNSPAADAQAWRAIPTGITADNVLTVAHHNGVYYSGTWGETNLDRGTVYRREPTYWGSIQPLPPPMFRLKIVEGMLFGITPTGDILRSPTGFYFSYVTGGRDIVYGNGRYVTVHDNGDLWSSPNLVQWTKGTPADPTTPRWSQISFGNNLFIATTLDLKIATSTDGVSWRRIPQSVFQGASFSTMAFFANRHWAAGNFAGIYASPDGVAWTEVSPSPARSLRVINSRLYAVGLRSIISTWDGETFTPPESLQGMDSSATLTDIASDGSTIMVSATSGRIYIRDYDAGSAPSITKQPENAWATPGTEVSFTVEVSSSIAPRFQWFRNDTLLPGETRRTLVIKNVQPSLEGRYTVRVSNPGGEVTSSAATLSVGNALLSNLSVRTHLPADQVMIVGFATQGGPKPVLIRAMGPSLIPLGVSGAMADPNARLFNAAGTLIDSNADWSGSSSVVAAMRASGAFPFASDQSKDAAIVTTATGGHTVHIAGPSAGNVLVEVYDAGSLGGPRLTNLSALTNAGTGDSLLIAGFTLGGSGRRNVLVRAIGPSLQSFGVSDPISDPKLTIYNSASVQVGENDDHPISLAGTFASVGAFSLPAGSKDAAMAISLPAGGYTVQITGANGGSGSALIEVYELP